MVDAPAIKKVVKKPKAVAAHPPFAKMIVEAIKALKDRSGSSRQAILKYVISNFKLDEKVAALQVRRALVAAVKAGVLKQAKGVGASGSFKLGEKVKATPKKKVVKKPKKVVVKTVAIKPKKVVKAKSVKKVVKKKAIKPKKASIKPKKPVVKKTPKKVVSKK